MQRNEGEDDDDGTHLRIFGKQYRIQSVDCGAQPLTLVFSCAGRKLPVALTFFAFDAMCDLLNVAVQYSPRSAFTSWMAQCSHLRIPQLTIPATHNSCAYRVDFAHPCPVVSKPLLGIFKHIPLGLVRRWVVCQRMTLWEQLMAGVRGLDLRIAQDDKGMFWVVHLFSLVPLDFCVACILGFVHQYSSEVILVRAKVSWDHREQLESQVVYDELLRLFGDCALLPATDAEHCTLGELHGSSRRVVLCCEGHTGMVQSHWANTSSVDELRASLKLQAHQRLSSMVEGSFVLTGTLGNVLSRDSVETFAAAANALMPELLRGEDALRFQYVSCDFMGSSELELIIQHLNGCRPEP